MVTEFCLPKVILKGNKKQIFLLLQKNNAYASACYFAAENASISTLKFVLKLKRTVEIDINICLELAINAFKTKNAKFLISQYHANINHLLSIDKKEQIFACCVRTCNNELMDIYIHQWNGQCDITSIALEKKLPISKIEMFWKKQCTTKKPKIFYRICQLFHQTTDLEIQLLCKEFLTTILFSSSQTIIYDFFVKSLFFAIQVNNLVLFQLLIPFYTTKQLQIWIDHACLHDGSKIIDFLFHKFNLKINNQTILNSIRHKKFAWIQINNCWNEIYTNQYFLCLLNYTKDLIILKNLYKKTTFFSQNADFNFFQDSVIKKCNFLVLKNKFDIHLFKWLFDLIRYDFHHKFSHKTLKLFICNGIMKPELQWFNYMLEDGELDCCVYMLKKHVLYCKPQCQKKHNILAWLLKNEVQDLLKTFFFQNISCIICEYTTNDDFFIQR